MSEKTEKLTWREGWKINLRAWKIWWKLCPRMFVASLLSAAFRSISPYVTIYLSARLIGELAGGRDAGMLTQWVLLQLGASALLMLLEGVLGRWYNYESAKAWQMGSSVYMDKFLSMDYADVDRQAVLDLYNQMRQNEMWAGWGLRPTLRYFEDLVSALVKIAGGVSLSVSMFILSVPQGSALVFLNNPLCAVAVIGLMLVIAVVSPMCANRSEDYWTRYAPEARLGNRYFSFFGFDINDEKRAADVRMYNQIDNVCADYIVKDTSFKPGSTIAKNAKGAMGLWSALSRCLSMVLTGAVYLFVCLKAWAGAFGVGAITQYVGAVTQLFLGVADLLKTLGTIRTNASFLKLCFKFLDIPNAMYQGSLTTEKRADRNYQVEFRDVSFKYPGSDQWALRHVNIRFRVGSRLAVVGQNGSGKTTFIKLLCRLYDPTEGEILLNGIDIRKYSYEDYINIFSVVFQDFKLLAMPLGQNVAGRVRYDSGRVLNCLRDAGFAERLSDMPKGLDTPLYKTLEEDGVEVSGGEAQKIAIARALYKDAPFIVLDEPTAALDPVAEAEIYMKFNDLVHDKTAIYISHRLSSCKFCDEIAVFDKGSIVQQGNHDALLEDRNGLYNKLWFAQAQYYSA